MYVWCMRRTNIYLEAEQALALAHVATAQGISRAELIRRLLDKGLRGGSGDEKFDLAAIESTAGAVPTADPFVRAADDRADDDRAAHLDRVWRHGG